MIIRVGWTTELQNACLRRYAKAPIDTLLSVGAIPSDYAALNQEFVAKFNSPYIPSFIDNCTFLLSGYPKDAWWTFEHLGGVPSYTDIEVWMTCSSYVLGVIVQALDLRARRSQKLLWPKL